MGNERSAPRMLPIVEYNGQSWFIDDRLGQFRVVWNAHDYVDFGAGQQPAAVLAQGRQAPSRDLRRYFPDSALGPLADGVL